jgi:hypothetical protein
MRRKMGEMPDDAPPEEMVEEKSEMMDDPMADGAETEESGMTVSADMLAGAKAGDTVSFKVVSIDPKTGEGRLEAVSEKMEM